MAFTSTKSDCVLVDMDGTLVDVASILYNLAPQSDGTYDLYKDFDAFHEVAIDCPPIQNTLDLLQNWHFQGTEIVVVTARSDKYYANTAWWLNKHNVPHKAVYMRLEGDFRQDYEVKKEILERIRLWWNPIHAIDDNPSVIKLWEEEGIPTTVVPGWTNG